MGIINGIGKGGDFAIVMLGFSLCDWSFGLYVLLTLMYLMLLH